MSISRPVVTSLDMRKCVSENRVPEGPILNAKHFVGPIKRTTYRQLPDPMFC
jgi:hypothetical protein